MPFKRRTARERRDWHSVLASNKDDLLHLVRPLCPNDDTGSLGPMIAPFRNAMSLQVVSVGRHGIWASASREHPLELGDGSIVVLFRPVRGLMFLLDRYADRRGLQGIIPRGVFG